MAIRDWSSQFEDNTKAVVLGGMAGAGINETAKLLNEWMIVGVFESQAMIDVYRNEASL